MSFGYVVRPRADRDIDEIAAYLTDEAGLDTALQFLAEIYETFGHLAVRLFRLPLYRGTTRPLILFTFSLNL